MNSIRRKVVVVGDGNCGKTSLIMTFYFGTCPDVFIPTTFGNNVADVRVDGKDVHLSVCDTSGQDEYDRLRPLSYPDSHLTIICFAIDNTDSLDNVKHKWAQEVLQHCPGIPFLLVGCKKDLRNVCQRPISLEQGIAVAQKVGAKQYIECSAKAGEGVDELFEYAARAALQISPPNSASCLNSSCVVL